MERKEIFEKLNEIFEDVLEIDSVSLKEETNADDIDEWDSLTHVQLIVAIQKEFGIKVNASDILRWRNVGEMVNSIEQLMN